MKSKILTTILSFTLLIFSANLQAESKWYKPYGAYHDAKCLKTAYHNIKNNIEVEKNQRELIDCFPKNFDRFIDIFGYQNSSYFGFPSEAGFLTEVSETSGIITYFVNLDTHKQNTGQVLSLAINGFWQVEGPNTLQNSIYEFVKNNPDASFKYLESLSDRDLDSFWFFYFDGRYPPKEFPTDLDKNKMPSKVLASALNAHALALKNKP